MHEQEFERSVQQRMEELSFTPSAPVWDRVEAELRGRRKKRRLVIWLLPLGVMMAAAGWYFFISSQDTISRALPGLAGKATSGKAGEGLPFKQTSRPEKKGANIVAPTKNQALVRLPDPKTMHSVKNRMGQKKADQVFGSFAVSRKKLEDGSAISFASQDSVAMSQQHRQATLIPVLEANQPVFLPMLHPGSPIPQVVFPAIKLPVASRWQLFLQMQYGRSQLAVAGMARPASIDFSGGPLQNNDPGLFTPAMRVDDGPYVAGEIGLRRKMGPRWYLHTGLHYARYTQRVSVGRKVSVAGFSDSRTFYDPINSESYYYNRFHLAGVRLALQYKPFRKLPLEMEAGFVPGYLFGARALRLDTTTRLYVEHKPELRRLQLPVMAGIQYRFAKNKSWEWLAGAKLQYHITGIHNRSKAPRLYALSMGVQLRKR